MSDESANGEDAVDTWEDLCWSPHEAAIRNGRQEGHEKGLEAGFQDGMQLGRTKGIEIGLELGYYRGLLRVIKEMYHQQQQQQQQDDDHHHSHTHEKIQKSLDDLSRAIMEEFPTPDQMFSNDHHSQHHHHQHHPDEHDDHEHGHDDSIDEPQSEISDHHVDEDSAKVDVMGKMQRIRMKFKLLMRQLKLPHVTLQSLMAEAQQPSDKTAPIADSNAHPTTPIMESFDVSDW